MSQPTLTRQQARQLDQRATTEFGVPSLILMENAGRGVADVLCEQGIHGPVLICCGKGNNGGDGFVIARHLELRGHDVRIAIWHELDAWSGDAATNLRIAELSRIPILFASNDETAWQRHLGDADWIVDALLGTGATGDPRPPYYTVITQINDAPGKRIAVDVPSGLNCDTGRAAPTTIQADVTCTFVLPKPGLLVPSAARYVGELSVLDIGAPRALLNDSLS